MLEVNLTYLGILLRTHRLLCTPDRSWIILKCDCSVLDWLHIYWILHVQIVLKCVLSAQNPLHIHCNWLCSSPHICYNIQNFQLLFHSHIEVVLELDKYPEIGSSHKFIKIKEIFVCNLFYFSYRKWQAFAGLFQCINIFPSYTFIKWFNFLASSYGFTQSKKILSYFDFLNVVQIVLFSYLQSYGFCNRTWRLCAKIKIEIMYQEFQHADIFQYFF